MERDCRKKVAREHPELDVYTSVEDAVKSTASTLGVRNHNPLNIRYGKSCWVGQLGENRGFVVFDTMSHGVRASFINARTLIRRGANTVEKLINKWAPPSENPTQNYVDFVCRQLDCVPTQKLSATDKELLLSVIMAMSLFESQYYITSLDYMEWINEV